MNMNVKFTVTQLVGASPLTRLFVTTLPDNFKLSDAFMLKDLADKDADDNIHAVWNDDVSKHCAMLTEFAQAIGGVQVLSWYRSPSTNRAMGSAENSMHLKGLATDIAATDMTEDKATYLVEAWARVCEKHKAIGSIKVYPDKVHLSSFEAGAKSFTVEYNV